MFHIGCVNGKDTEVKGKVDIPNLSEEHEDMKDVDVDVSLTTKGPEADILKVWILYVYLVQFRFCLDGTGQSLRVRATQVLALQRLVVRKKNNHHLFKNDGKGFSA